MNHAEGEALSIVAEGPVVAMNFAKVSLYNFREEFPEDIFTICDENGPLAM